MSNTWTWLEEFAERAYAADDRARIRLLHLSEEAYRLRETDLAAALALLREASVLAGTLGEVWCQLHYDHMHQDILLHQGGDSRTALDLAVRNVLEARKPLFQHFPRRFSIHLSLVCTYLSIDPVGYEPEIREVLAYLDDLMGPDHEDGQAYLEMQKVRLALKIDRVAEAQRLALGMLALAEGDGPAAHRTYSVYAHSLLCRIAYRLGDLGALAGWARDGVERARQIREGKHQTAMLIWQAVLARQAGDEPAARHLYERGTAQALRWHGLRFGGYYNALSAFHAIKQEWAEIVRVRTDHWENVQGCGRWHDEAFVRLCQCETLARLGRLTPEASDTARTAARRLRSPGATLAAIDRLANGNA